MGALRTFDTRCAVARLFGPLKARDYVHKLRSSLRPARICVGTPGKLLRLAELGAFDVHNLRLLLADMYVDAKARHICSMQVSHVCPLYVCLTCVPYLRAYMYVDAKARPRQICSIQVPFICARCDPCMCPVLYPLHVPLICSSKPTLATFCRAGSLSVPLTCAPYGGPCTCINASALIKTQIHNVKPRAT